MTYCFLVNLAPPVNFFDYLIHTVTRDQRTTMSSNRIQDMFDNSQDRPNENSFESVTDSQLASHLQVNQYDNFQLTDAVRPAMDLKIKPTQGYRHEVYVDEESNSRVPVVMSAASRDKLFPLFMQLIQKLGPVVDVVLESSHAGRGNKHVDLYREHIDMPVLTSVLWDYEDLLLNDGCTGIAVLNPNTPQEIQFEEHKLLIVYGSPLEQFEFVMEQHGVCENQNMKFITEAEHVHSSTDEYARRFNELRTDLGLDGSQAVHDQEQEGGEQYGEEGGGFYGEDNHGGLM